MNRFLRGLLIDLESQSAALANHPKLINAAGVTRDHALDAYRRLEVVRRAVGKLLKDPALESPELLKNHLQQYNRWFEKISSVEWYLVPFIERFNEDDNVLTNLTKKLVDQVNWPLPGPLVSSFSNTYFWTKPEFNIICTPSQQGHSLLSFPDICHELGHILLVNHAKLLLGEINRQFQGYIEKEKRLVIQEQRPPHYAALYDDLYAVWIDLWVWEFCADIIATYLIGAPFGLQNIRLSAGMGSEVYLPVLGDLGTHPADDARMIVIIRTLERMGENKIAEDLESLWAIYLSVRTENQPADYKKSYPVEILNCLISTVINGCQELGIRPFKKTMEDKKGIISQVTDAWAQFMGA
jgi:hypothetical protein